MHVAEVISEMLDIGLKPLPVITVVFFYIKNSSYSFLLFYFAMALDCSF